MSKSPRNFFSHLTVNRGVEAREFQMENPRLDADTTSDDSERRRHAYAAGDAAATSENSPSFVQVVVHKQRLAAASSPAAPAAQRARIPHKPNSPQTPPTPVTQVGADAAAALLAPALVALQRQLWDKVQSLNNVPQAQELYTAAMSDVNEKRYTGDQKSLKNTIWNKVSRMKEQDLDFGKDMDRIEVFQFERGAALLCTRRGVHESHVERVARRLAQPATVMLRELLGAMRVLVAAPLHVALQVVRCAADSARDSVGGTSDVLLKPLLVLAFNALLRPPLLLVGATCTALREAAHPAVLLLSDALEAAARPLAALRLVHVEHGCACACRVVHRV